MDIYLTGEELADMASKMNAVVDAIFGGEGGPVLKPARVSQPLGLRETLWLKKLPPVIKVQGIRFASGIEDMEGVLFRDNGQNMVAVKVCRYGRHLVDLEVYTVADYIRWIIGSKHRLAVEARMIVARAQWELEQMLPRGHKLKKQPYVELNARTRRQRIAST